MKDITISRNRSLLCHVLKRIKSTFLNIFIVAIFLFSSSFFSQSESVRDFFSLPDPARCTSNDLDIISADLDLPNCVCTDGQTVTAGLTLGIRNNTESLRASFSFWAQLTVTNPDDNSQEYYMLEGCENEILPGNDYLEPPRTKLATFSSLLVYKYNNVSDQYELVTDNNGDPIPEIPYTCGTSLELTNIYQGWTDASKNDNRQCGGIDASKVNPKCGIIPVLGVGVGLSASSESTDISCNGAGDGSMKITFSGGQAPYFLDTGDGNGYSTTPIDLTKLPPGPPYEITLSNLPGNNTGTIYNWKIKDSSDPFCEKGDSETFTDPAPLTLNIDETDISCNGAGDGEISILNTSSDFDSYQLYKVVGDPDFDEVQGDTPDTAEGSPITTASTGFSGLAVGSYYVIGTVDSVNQPGTNCTATSGAEVIDDAAPLTLNIDETDISCNGAGDGEISILNTSSDFDSYQLYKVVGDPDFDEVQGDTPDTAEGSPITTASTGFSGLAVGSYYVIGTVDSVNQPGTNCTATSGAEVIDDAAPLTLNIDETDISCNGAGDGEISILNTSSDFDSYQLYKVVGDPDFDEVQGDTPDTAEGSPITTASTGFSGLAVGSYYVIGTVDSVNQPGTNCTATSGAEVIDDAAPLTLNIDETDISCNGAGDGEISILNTSSDFDSYQLYKVVGDPDFDEVQGDTPDTAEGSPITTASTGFSGLAAGSYYVIGTVDSVNQPGTNCTATSGAEVIDDAAPLTLNIDETDISCNGAGDGEISILNTSSDFDSYQLYKVVGDPDFDEVQGDTPDTAEGSPITTASTGFSGLAAGSYYVIGTVDSVNQPGTNCTATSGAEVIDDAAPLTLNIDETDISCNGAGDGEISILNTSSDFDSYQLYKVVGDPDFDEVQGDTPDTAEGSPITTASTGFSGLAVGSYYVIGTVDSVNQPGTNCTATSGAEVIDDAAPLTLNIDETDISCNGAGDGEISILNTSSDFDSYQLYKVVGDPDFDEVQGDTPDTAEGSPITTASTGFSGLAAGSYYVIGTVDSVNQPGTNCTATSGAEVIDDAAPLTLNIDETDISCNGAGDGEISILNTSSDFDSYQLYKVVGDPDFDEVQGDTPDTAEGSPITTASTGFSGLAVGSYYVIGTVDSVNQPGTNCTATSGAEVIDDAAPLSLTISPSDETCAGDDGAINLSGSNNSAFDNYQLYKVVGDPDFDEVPDDSADTAIGSPVSDVSSGFAGILPGSYYLIGTVDSSNQPGTNCTATSNVATVNGPTDCNQLFPTQTDCNAFQNCDRSQFVQTYLCVAVKKGKKNGPIKIANVFPGAYFYYGNFVPKMSEGKYIVTLQQEMPEGFPAFKYFNDANVNIYTEGCGNVQIDKVTIDESAAGLYKVIVEYTPSSLDPHVIGVKFDSKSIIGFETTQADVNNKSYLFGLVIDEVKQGPSFGSLYLDSNNGCSDAAEPPANDCESQNSSSDITLQSEFLTKESISTLSLAESSKEEPSFSLAPVPFKEQLTLRYEFDYTSNVKIQFFDLNGSLLRTYADKQVTNGDETQINIDFALKANQVYIMRVETDRDSFSKQVMSGN